MDLESTPSQNAPTSAFDLTHVLLDQVSAHLSNPSACLLAARTRSLLAASRVRRLLTRCVCGSSPINTPATESPPPRSGGTTGSRIECVSIVSIPRGYITAAVGRRRGLQ